MASPEKPLTPDQITALGALQRAADNMFETGLLQLMYDLDAGEEVQDMDFAWARDDHVDEGQTDAVRRIDELCRALGVDPDNWSASFLGGTVDRAYYQTAISRKDVRRSVLVGRSIGKYITELAFDVLPIEQYEDGVGYVKVSLARGEEHVLTLEAEANLDISWPDASDEEDQDDAEESQMNYQMTYRASIARVEP